MKPKASKPVAKPKPRIEYGVELAEQILDPLIAGKTLVEIETLDGMPSKTTILKWRRQHEEFGGLYEDAVEMRADADAGDVDDVARKMLKGEIDAAVVYDQFTDAAQPLTTDIRGAAMVITGIDARALCANCLLSKSRSSPQTDCGCARSLKGRRD